MRNQKQAILGHNPKEGVYGDCFRTALANLLDLDRDEVPHFMDGGNRPDNVWPTVNKWLNVRGLHLVAIAFQCELNDLFVMMKRINPGVIYLLAGSSERGVVHQVIACDDKIIQDPHPSGIGVSSPCEDGHYWINFVIPATHHKQIKE